MFSPQELDIYIPESRNQQTATVPLQYLIYEVEQLIVTEIWLEPQSGVLRLHPDITHVDRFNEVCRNIFEADSQLIDATYTFDFLKLLIQNPQMKADLDDFDDTIQVTHFLPVSCLSLST